MALISWLSSGTRAARSLTNSAPARLLTAAAAIIACGLALGVAPAPATPAAPAAAPRPATGTPILVGHYASLTGAEATFGQSTSEGIRLALKEINAAGGIDGRPIELREYDTKGEPKEATLAVTRLIKSDNVVAVLGEVASSLSLAGAEVCKREGVPMITPSSTNVRVTKVGDMIFRVCFTDPFQASACARFASGDLKAKTVAILHDQKSAYSIGLAEEFKAAFKKLGGNVVSEQTYSGGDGDFTTQLTSIRSRKPDVLFVPGYYTDVGNIALQTRKLGITCPMLGGDGWDSEKLAQIAGKAIEGSFYSNHCAPDQPDEQLQTFISKYRADYKGKTPDGLAALGYDAAMILADSIKRAGSTDSKKLRDAIASTKDYKGVTGMITIDANRNATKNAVIVEMKGAPLTPKYRATMTP